MLTKIKKSNREILIKENYPYFERATLNIFPQTEKTGWAETRLTTKVKILKKKPLDFRKDLIKNYRFYLKGKIKIKREIPHYKPNRKRYEVKKLEVSHLLYSLAIKRWTKIAPKKMKEFLNVLLEENYYRGAMLTTLRGERMFRPSSIRSLQLKRKLNKKYLKIKSLRTRLLSQLPKKFFKKPSKFRAKYNIPNRKQTWLSKNYIWLKNQSKIKKGLDQDFLKTVIGQQLLRTHLMGQHAAYLCAYFDEKSISKYSDRLTPLPIMSLHARGIAKRSWFYTNSILPKSVPYEFNHAAFRATYPFKLFYRYWQKQEEIPWLDAVETKRALYSSFLQLNTKETTRKQQFLWIPYLRKKKPLFQKRNQLYYWYNKLLFDSWTRNRIRSQKKGRIKQVLEKVILPFYGHLKPKQFKKIKRKAQIKKPELISRETTHLSYLETRLDVIVYRLNFAPNIFWARKLIKDGSIFVTNPKYNHFEKMYAPLKKNVYPLKLRDPLNLYKKTLWSNNAIPHLKFFLEPVRNINYLTQPGEVILCAPVANQYKTERILWKKPIPSHLLTFTPSHTEFHKSKLKAYSKTPINAGTLIFHPTYNDLDITDRIQRTFIRWL